MNRNVLKSYNKDQAHEKRIEICLSFLRYSIPKEHTIFMHKASRNKTNLEKI